MTRLSNADIIMELFYISSESCSKTIKHIQVVQTTHSLSFALTQTDPTLTHAKSNQNNNKSVYCVYIER
mgnify:CR=1 FL=1